jgi:hypothetical protein
LKIFGIKPFVVMMFGHAFSMRAAFGLREPHRSGWAEKLLRAVGKMGPAYLWTRYA